MLQNVEMLDLLKAILDLVTGGTQVAEMKRISQEREEMSTLGYDLFKLYSALNSIYTNGIQIVDLIESDIRKADTRSEHISVLQGETLSRLVAQQRHIGLAMDTVADLAEVLQITSPTTLKSLIPFLNVKSDLIDWLLKVDQASMTIRLGDFENLKLEASKIEPNYQTFIVPYDQDGVAGNPVETLRAYLAYTTPRERLSGLDKCLEEFREAILANFDAKDLIVRAGKARTHLDWPYGSI